VEALNWDGTPCTGRSLDWQTGPGAKLDAVPPQMCFNSKAIQREVQQRSALLGKAIQAGVNRLQQLKRAELFAGVIVGSETQIGQDYQSNAYLGYRGMLNRGYSDANSPSNPDQVRVEMVQEFIQLWRKRCNKWGKGLMRLINQMQKIRLFIKRDIGNIYRQVNSWSNKSLKNQLQKKQQPI
jgi:hypothetical protein